MISNLDDGEPHTIYRVKYKSFTNESATVWKKITKSEPWLNYHRANEDRTKGMSSSNEYILSWWAVGDVTQRIVPWREWMVRIPCQSHWSNYSSKWKLREILTMYILEMWIVINFLWIFLFLKHCIWLSLCEMVKNGCNVIYKVFDPTDLPNDQIFLEERLGFHLTLYYVISPSLCSALCLQMIFYWGGIMFFKKLALHLHLTETWRPFFYWGN